jgi:hypothetical protein
MRNQKFISAILLFTLATLQSCDFIGAVFKTGVGVGVFLVVAILVVIFMISRRGRRGV